MQRLSLEAVIISKRCRTVGDVEGWSDLLARFRISQEEKVRLIVESRAGNSINTERIGKVPDMEVEFTIPEAQRVLDRLDEWREESGLNIPDLVWYKPLRAQLADLLG
jgi:hypothetical protein